MTETAPLLAWDPQTCTVGNAEMDARHREFVELLNGLNDTDDAGFAAMFDHLCEHTRQHFAAEESRMRQCSFPALAEHCGEHHRVLGELAQIGRLVGRGRLALGRAYASDSLPHWFRLHLATMDSALAAHWKRHIAGTRPS